MSGWLEVGGMRFPPRYGQDPPDPPPPGYFPAEVEPGVWFVLYGEDADLIDGPYSVEADAEGEADRLNREAEEERADARIADIEWERGGAG